MYRPLLLLLLALWLPACRQAKPPVELRVAAAADLQFALPEVLAAFQQAHPGVTVQPTFGASGTLFAQIENGAPFDVILAADARYTEKLAAHGHAKPADLFLYAVGRLVVWVPQGSPLELEQRGMVALADERVRKIALANPAHAPYGAAAMAAQQHFHLAEPLKAKLVLGENVAQAAQFVESGAAEAGIIAHSLASAPKIAGKGRFWEVPAEAFPRLEQGGAVLAHTKQPELCRELRAFLLTGEGRTILARFGFQAP